MNNPVATIVSITGGRALLSVRRDAVCARCASGKGCGGAFPGPRSKLARISVLLPQTLNLSAGDRVELGLKPVHVLKAALLVYGLPLAGMVTTILMARLLRDPLSDASAIVAAAAGLLAGFFFGRRRLGREGCLQQFMPRILGRVSGSIE